MDKSLYSIYYRYKLVYIKQPFHRQTTFIQRLPIGEHVCGECYCRSIAKDSKYTIISSRIKTDRQTSRGAKTIPFVQLWRYYSFPSSAHLQIKKSRRCKYYTLSFSEDHQSKDVFNCNTHIISCIRLFDILCLALQHLHANLI